MHEAKLLPAPAWVRLAATIIRRLPAGRYRAMNRVSRRPPSAFLMQAPEELGGYVFKCDLRDSMAREVCFTGRYEPQETALVRAILRPGMTFVDGGANWGYFTLLAAHLVGESGRVISLEPDPRLFPILQENVRRNELSQVTTLQLAAADRPGTLTLAGYDERNGNWGLSKLIDRPALGSTTFQVASQRLDAVLDEHRIDEVDLLKMDIEGAEDLALRGMSVGLARHRHRRILLEVHPTILAERGRTARDVLELLTENGYVGWWIDHSLVGTRRVAYTRSPDPRHLLRPLCAAGPLDAWPHMLWLSPGLEPLS